MITRTLTTFEATAYTIVDDGETPTLEVMGKAQFVATKPNKADARKALIAAGIDVPRGTTINIKEVDTITYGCELDEFLKIAHPVVKADELTLF